MPWDQRFACDGGRLHQIGSVIGYSTALELIDAGVHFWRVFTPKFLHWAVWLSVVVLRLSITLITTATFCMWLLWILTWLSQWHPLIVPTKGNE